jgi:hypothetical protein
LLPQADTHAATCHAFSREGYEGKCGVYSFSY